MYAVAAGSALLASCTQASHPAANGRARASTAGPGSIRYVPLADCPVTRGVPGTRPPPALNYQPPPPVPYVHDWYGTEVIWVMLPTRGRLPAQLDPAPGWPARSSTKFPWYGLRPGQLRITGQRLDGPGRFAAQIGTTQQGYGPPGFVPSTLHWSAPGCWRLTATLAGSSLSYTTRVYPLTTPVSRRKGQ